MAGERTYTFYVHFDADGGSFPVSQVYNTETSAEVSVTVTVTIPSTLPTKSGYKFSYWNTTMGKYSAGNKISKTFTRNTTNQTYHVYATAVYVVDDTASRWSTKPSSVLLDGSTSYSFTVSRGTGVDHHTMKFTLGSKSLTYTNVGNSKSVTFPSNWVEQVTTSTTGQIVATLISYNSSGGKIGSVNSTVSGKVPTSIVPTLSITHERVNPNATVASWDILVQGYSKIKFTATAAGASGSTITKIVFSGANLQKSGTATTATSNVFTVNGTQTWTVTATDSRGRTATQTYSELIYEYSYPRLSSMEVYRCNSDGTLNGATGTHCLFTAHYGISRCNGNNSSSVRAVDSKLSTASTWTRVYSPYTVDTSVVLAGTYDVDKEYDIRFTVTDGLGNTLEEIAKLSTVMGFALGLKNDRARFGGIPYRAGLTIDWDTYIDGAVTLGNRQILKSLWTGSWSSGDITVDGLSNYTLFIVKMQGQGTAMLVTLNGTYFRGDGGYAASSTIEAHYYINATLSGDTLTMVSCHSISGTTQTDRTVIEIIGVI